MSACESLPQWVAHGRYDGELFLTPGDPIKLSQPWSLSLRLSTNLSYSLWCSFSCFKVQVLHLWVHDPAVWRLTWAQKYVSLSLTHTHTHYPLNHRPRTTCHGPLCYKCIWLPVWKCQRLPAFLSITTRLCSSCFGVEPQLELTDNGCCVWPCFHRFCFK